MYSCSIKYHNCSDCVRCLGVDGSADEVYMERMEDCGKLRRDTKRVFRSTLVFTVVTSFFKKPLTKYCPTELK